MTTAARNPQATQERITVHCAAGRHGDNSRRALAGMTPGQAGASWTGQCTGTVVVDHQGRPFGGVDGRVVFTAMSRARQVADDLTFRE